MSTKIAAIWARVSSPDQTSLPDQVARAKEKLVEKGYIVPEDRILMVDWTSLELFSCPQFLQLAGWVKRKEIQALGVLDRDRLEAQPEQRLAFLAELRQAGVELVVCQGPPMLEGDWGMLIEHVYGIAKKQQVLRAKLGAKDGMHDKVTKDRKPVGKHRIFGWKWTTDQRLEPDYLDHETVKIICDLGKAGAPYSSISKELKKQGKLTARGLTDWDRSTIRGILFNPVNAGRYYGGRYERVVPHERRGDTYGNSSFKTRPLAEATYLPEVEIINPPLTWNEREQIIERRLVNQKLAKRNGNRDYLLRGFIRCYTHYGKRGEPRVYRGKTNGNSYVCPVGGCGHPSLSVPRIEAKVKKRIRWLLELQPKEFYRYIGNKGNVDETRQSLERELKSLAKKENGNINAETELVHLRIRGQVSNEAYERERGLLLAERKWIEERKEVIEGQLQQLAREADIAETWWELREQAIGRLPNFTNADWRELFIRLNMEIQVRDKSNPQTWRDSWYLDETGHLRDRSIVNPVTKQVSEAEVDDIEICFGLPVKIDTEHANHIGEIVFTTPSCSS